ncbi:CBS domain-containing protein [Desulfuribacillus alkaliarsenatis]|uniref:CBS domain-containing protein n=1 Tax=Desulfuribacillus alkaliarsenatis TaxID=766136 RepID=A0A1E5G411_9FIRM|nr:CBS domain-containing protein [Desulfuribacillus alkaliarsenatis]OEF97735.1 hypothetical protein BHF68_14155 [Desulfuribacillus alkaliarsenatis]
MQVIVSHINIDFDGLASIVAAKKLYPKAKMVLPDKISIPVQQFLAIYRDSFEFYVPRQIDWKLVTHVIMVDIANLERLGAFTKELPKEGIHYTVYDHHQPHETDIKADSGNVELIGATVTMLLEQIEANKIPITSFEATVMAIGLYSDTGSFTYLGTTARDMKAASYLMEQGANLAIVASYTDRPLLQEQQQILNSLLLNATEIQVQGIEILISWHRQKDYLGGLAILARKLLDVTGSHAAFIVVEMAKKVFIIGRSSTERVDVLPIISSYDGGGHSKAASASVKHGDCLEIVKQIKEALPSIVRAAVVARGMMTSAVKTIAPETTIEDAAKMMLRYGHTGFPIVKGEQLVGIISRRDLDKATHHGLGHAPVKGFMSKDLVTITPDTTLEEIQNIMIEHNVGRMPVMDNNQLVGIVSRTDVVEFLHGKDVQTNAEIDGLGNKPIVMNLMDAMNKNIDDIIYSLLRNIGEKADKLGFKAYIIGGVVRDLVIGFKNEDIDIVVEGDGIQFAQMLAEEFGGSVRSHEKFGTATWKTDEFCVANKSYCREGLKFDITTARREYYDYPAALPTVERSSLKEDLYRRDFTINAMAIQINDSEFGKLIDYFHGIKDINNKKIRVLYNLSFVEDPTRILRAVRFEQRFGFLMDGHTQELALNSLDKIPAVSEVRIANELKNLFQEQHPVEAIERLAALGVWDYIIGDGVASLEVLERVKELKGVIKIVTNKNVNNQDIHITSPYDNDKYRFWICYLASLFYDNDQWLERVQRFTLNNDDVEVLNHIQKLEAIWQDKIFMQTSLGVIHRELYQFRVEAIIFVLTLTSDYRQQAKTIIEYLQKRVAIPALLTGKKLKELGIKPGPIYSEILFEYECAYLNGEISNKDQINYWLQSCIDDR